MEKEKIWTGRIQKKSDALAEKFTASINIDRTLYLQDLTGTVAYAIGLESIGVISSDGLKEILAGLKEVKEKIESGKVSFEDYEDIHSLVEFELAKISGDAAGRIHTGRSRNDQIVVDELLFLKGSIAATLDKLTALEKVILEKAIENLGLIFPAYTHMQKAQPVLVSHYFLSYFEKFSRNIKKLSENFDDCDFLPLGAGACTGSGYLINRELLARLLRFSRLGTNSMDIVSSRDFMMDYIYCCCSIMLNLSRFCEDLIIYNSREFSYINIDESFCTGSSIMPQKKNPDILELIRGKSALAIGSLVQILALLKGLPSTYNSDMQEDKKILLSVKRETLDSLEIFAKVLEGIDFNRKAVTAGLESGLLEATDAADYLVKKGENFRNAHHIIGKIVRHCMENNLKLKNLPLEKLKQYSKYFASDFYNFIKVKSCINSKVTGCGTSEKAVKSRISENKKAISVFEKSLSGMYKRIPDFDEIIADSHE